MNVRDAYNQWAVTYDSDRNLTRDLDQAVTRETLGNGRYTSILELGCGTGKNTVLLAQLGERVQSLDFSEEMLSQARAKQPGASVTFSVADLTQPWPCADRSVDLVVCNLVLEHIADLDFTFAEAARVLVAGGQFFICELHPFKQYQGSVAVFHRGGERTNIPAFVHHISDFVAAADSADLRLASLKEWWHAADQNTVPRVVSFLFEKPSIDRRR